MGHSRNARRPNHAMSHGSPTPCHMGQPLLKLSLPQPSLMGRAPLFRGGGGSFKTSLMRRAPLSL